MLIAVHVGFKWFQPHVALLGHIVMVNALSLAPVSQWSAAQYCWQRLGTCEVWWSYCWQSINGSVSPSGFKNGVVEAFLGDLSSYVGNVLNSTACLIYGPWPCHIHFGGFRANPATMTKAFSSAKSGSKNLEVQALPDLVHVEYTLASFLQFDIVNI